MKWIVRIIGAVVLIAVLAVVGVLMLPADRIARIASEQLTRVTGRSVTITGDVGMTFWPVLGVNAGGLTLGNAEWAGEDAMLSTAQAAIGVDASSLLRGDIRITHVEATNPTIRLQSRADGRANWLFTDGAGDAAIETETEAGTPQRPITIERLVIRNAALVYDAEGSDLVSYDGVDLTLDWPDPASAAQIDAVLRPAGDAVTIAARIDRFAGFLNGEVQPVSVNLGADKGALTLEGRGSLQGAVAGRLEVDWPQTSAFLAALGLGGVDLPEGLGRSLKAGADVTLTPDRKLALRDMQMDLGGNSLSGAADIELNGTPQVNAQLTAGALDLAMLSEGGGSSEGQAASAGWSRAPIDAAGLSAFNGAIALSAQSIDLGTLTLGKTRSLLTNDRARMVFELREVVGYGGVTTGQFVMNNRNGLSVGGKLRAAGVQMNPLLSDLAGLTRFTGTGDAELSFLGVGETLEDIMRSLSGNGAFSVGRGSIEGIDLDDLLGSFDVQGGTTVFDEMRASFAMENGVLRNNDLTMLLPNFETTGAGQVGLGAQTIDYTVTPKALRVNKDRGLAVPVRIVGPWSGPSIKPDLKAVLDLNFQQEKDRAEEKVKQKVDQKLQEELGIVRENGQSVEDAVKDRVEDKLKKELFKLFD